MSDGRVLDIPTAEVFEPLDKSDCRYVGAEGGRGGAKSHYFAGKLIDDSLYERGMLSVCIREVQKSLEQSSKRLITQKLSDFNLGEADGFKVYDKLIETPGDGIIIFQGMQDHTADSIKSLEGFKRAWWEEAQTASPHSLDIFRPTMRAKGARMYFSWNPKNPPDPKKPMASIDGIFGGHIRDAAARAQWIASLPGGGVHVHTDFDDNPWLSDDLNAEQEWDLINRHPEDYAHIWRGRYQLRSEAQVFRNWKVKHFDVPPDAVLYQGADFGFSVDPSCIMQGFIGRMVGDRAVHDPNGKTFFLRHEAYRVGCDVDFTPALFAGNCPYPPSDDRTWRNPYNTPGIPNALHWRITADSARPETISYLSRRGFDIAPAVKGAGSVVEGIEFLNSYEIVIHPECIHAIDEFTFYKFKVDPKTDLVTSILEDKKNHVIDSVRYALEGVRRGRGFFDS